MNLKLHLNRESDELVLVQRVGRGTNSANDDGAYFRTGTLHRARARDGGAGRLSPRLRATALLNKPGNGGSEQCPRSAERPRTPCCS